MTNGGDAPKASASVVVPTAGSSALLGRCLTSLRRQTVADVEVIVVDGVGAASAAVERHLPAARVVAPGRNLGFAGAVNLGARFVTAPYFACVNDDVELEPDWLAESIACAERHLRAAAVASKVLLGEDRRVLDGAGDEMTRSLKAYRRGQGLADDGRFDAECEVFSASGTACLWRTDVFHGLGGYDESFFAYYEDVDLGWRARRSGFEAWYAPRAVAVHRGSATAAPRQREFEFHYAVRNRWATALKNASSGWLLRQLSWIALGETMSLARAAAAGEIPAVISAYVRVGREARALRRACPSTKAVSEDELRNVVVRRLPPLRTSRWRHALVRQAARHRRGSVGAA